jgi:hypothetical protein
VLLIPVEDHTDAWIPTAFTYPLSVTCQTCGESHVGIFEAGYEPWEYKHLCPHCCCSGRFTFGTSYQGRQWLHNNAQAQRLMDAEAQRLLPAATVKIYGYLPSSTEN